MRTSLLTMGLIALLLCSLSAAEPEIGSLQVTVHLPLEATGEVRAILCTTLSQFLDQEAPAAQAAMNVHRSPAILLFTNLPTGRYALKAYLDLNQSCELERDLLGRPREPWALSNGIRAKPSRSSWPIAIFQFQPAPSDPRPSISVQLEP